MEITKTHRPALRAFMFLFGAGLIVLWIIGLATNQRSWFGWVDVIGGSLGLYTAVIMPDLEPGLPVSVGYVFSLGLIALWIVGLATGVTGWLVWVTFGLAVMLLLGTVYGTPSEASRHQRITT